MFSNRFLFRKHKSFGLVPKNLLCGLRAGFHLSSFSPGSFRADGSAARGAARSASRGCNQQARCERHKKDGPFEIGIGCKRVNGDYRNGRSAFRWPRCGENTMSTWPRYGGLSGELMRTACLSPAVHKVCACVLIKAEFEMLDCLSQSTLY